MAPWRRIALVQLTHDLQLDLVMVQEVSIVAEPGFQSEDLGVLLYTSVDCCGRGGVGVLIGPRLRQSVLCISLSLLRVDVYRRARCVHIAPFLRLRAHRCSVRGCFF